MAHLQSVNGDRVRKSIPEYSEVFWAGLKHRERAIVGGLEWPFDAVVSDEDHRCRLKVPGNVRFGWGRLVVGRSRSNQT